MSADNWALCPKCEEKRTTDLEVPRIGYEFSLYENYNATIGDGKLYVDYYCSCKTCGFSLEFNHTEQLEIK